MCCIHYQNNCLWSQMVVNLFLILEWNSKFFFTHIKPDWLILNSISLQPHICHCNRKASECKSKILVTFIHLLASFILINLNGGYNIMLYGYFVNKFKFISVYWHHCPKINPQHILSSLPPNFQTWRQKMQIQTHNIYCFLYSYSYFQ